VRCRASVGREKPDNFPVMEAVVSDTVAIF
jgi:hypothetical protein